MAFESYNAQDIWSSGEAPGSSSNLLAAGKLGLAVAAGGAGFSMLTKSRADGTRPIDAVSSFTRTIGNATPFQIGNTFRIPEFLSPFTSPSYQGLSDGQHIFTQDFLKSNETTQYLQKVTGKSYQELHGLGLSQEALMGAEGAESLVYRAGKSGSRGTLHVKHKGAETLLSDAVMLMSRDTEVDPFRGQTRTENKAFKGILQALDMWENEGFNSKNLLASGETRSPVAFIPSIDGPLKSFGDLGRRTSYFRGIAAFETSRFNELMGNYAHQIFGESGGRFAKTVFGLTNEVRPGPASALLARYAGRATMLGGAALLVSQSDWIRRQGGMPGQAVAAAGTTAAGAYAAWKMGAPNKLVMMGAVASFFGQMTLPGFDKGLVEGVASTAAGLDVFRGNPLNPFGYYRRAVEGFAPGISDWKTGAAIGLGVMAVSAMRLPGSGKRISEHVVEKLGAKRLGITSGAFGVAPDELLSTRDMFWREMEATQNPIGRGSEKWRSMSGRREIYNTIKEQKGGHLGASQFMNKQWRKAEDVHRDMMQKSFEKGINRDLLNDLGTIANKYNQGNGIQRKIMMQAEGFVSQVYHSFFGADANYDRVMRAEVEKLGFAGITPVGKLGRLATLGLAAMGAQQLLTGGLLGSMESSGELSDIYAGRKLVEVKKARGWEGGGQPFGGGETSYFRPHALALMNARTRERGIWGEGEDDISPLMKFFKKNFTYDLERQNYFDRPYPISSAFGQDIPIIGGLLASTIGRLIKPAKLMHTEEWAREGQDGNAEFRSIYKGSRQEPAYALGAQGPGTPVSPFALSEQAMFMSDQMRQLSGFPGFVRNTFQKIVTGHQNFVHNQPVLASSGDMTSPGRMFWESELGGGFFSTELWRRLFPRNQPGLEKVNPIRNNMPSWLPDKFHTGDAYANIQWGEARLPGPGYASLHPELRGVDPEEYPLIARMAILGDIAPASIEYRRMQEQVYMKRQQGAYSEVQNAFIDQVDERVAQQMNQYTFNAENPRAINMPGSGPIRSMWGGALSAVRHVAAPAEYLIPMGFRPTQKLLSDYRDPIESYEHERLYGTQVAFWDKPMRDWFRPAAYSAAHMMGFDGKPAWRREADAVDQKFDEIEFHKWMTLALQAEQAGDSKAKNQYMWAASNTRAGINPQGSALSIYWTLPESERSFFNSFAMAQGKERNRVLEMVPEDQGHLYTAIWSRIDSGDQSVLSGGGQGVDENYLRAKYYQQPQGDMPPEDWIGWHCLPPEQLVLSTDMEAQKVCKMMPGYTVWQTGVYDTVQEVFMRDAIKEEMYTVMVDRDRVNSMMATADHAVLAWRCEWCPDHIRRKLKGSVEVFEKDFKIEWIRMKDLLPTDYLVIPITEPAVEPNHIFDMLEFAKAAGLKNVKHDEEHVWVYYKDKHNYANCFPRYFEVTEDIAWLIGYYLAEGNCLYRHNLARGVNFTSNLYEEADVRKKCLSILEFAGVEGVAEYARVRGSGSSGSVSVNNTFFALIVQHFAPGVVHTKQIKNASQLLVSRGHREALLAGYFVGDGSKNEVSVTSSSVSETLSRQVYELLLSCGIIPSLSAGIKENRRPYWLVRFGRENLSSIRIHDHVIRGRKAPRRVSGNKYKNFIFSGYLFSRISTITHEEYSGPVYDMEIKTKHEYRSPIGLYHNSEVDISDIKVRYAEQYASDISDYGVWESQVKKSEGQEFLDGSQEYVASPSTIAAQQIKSKIWNMSGGTQNRPGLTSVFPSSTGSRVRMTYNDHRDDDIYSAFQRMITGGY